MRYLSILTFLVINAAVSHLCQAGIVLDSIGTVDEWSRDNSSNRYYFHGGSYNQVGSIVTVVGDIAERTESSERFQDELQNESTANQDVAYIFATNQNDPTAYSNDYIDGIVLYYYDDTEQGLWVIDKYNGTDGILKSATTFTGFDGQAVPIYWASTTARSSGAVPEPSTAIAMGLLGIVGFAGNRRRRRQS